jgi:hypothetical protein
MGARRMSAVRHPQEIKSPGECTMENNAGSEKRVLSREEEAAKAAILAECEKLAEAGITFVGVHFDGYGGSRSRSTSPPRWPYYAYQEHEPVDYDASHLQEQFEALVPLGYENDCGGFGDVVLDVAARKITVERNDRFEDYTTTTCEV